MLTNLNKPQEQNITGLCKFWFAPVDWFSFLSIKHLTNLEIKYLEFKKLSPNKWLSAYHNNELTEIETTPTKTDSGISYKSQLNLFVPTDNEDLRLQLHQMEQQRFIVLIKETSGTIKIIGDLNAACSIISKFVNKPNKKGYDIVFSCENNNLPYIYKGVMPI